MAEPRGAASSLLVILGPAPEISVVARTLGLPLLFVGAQFGAGLKQGRLTRWASSRGAVCPFPVFHREPAMVWRWPRF